MTEPQRMSASEARSFERFSVANAVQVEEALECGCQAYRDVFTYKRWQAQGYQVRRGEKAVRLPLHKTVTQTDKETGEETTRSVRTRSAVFCRCQVQPKAARS